MFEALRRELNMPAAQPSDTRRNVFVTGANLAALLGQEFEVQGVRFAGVEECRPCYWMNNALRHSQAEEWLKGRGGLRARIVTGGVLRPIPDRNSSGVILARGANPGDQAWSR